MTTPCCSNSFEPLQLEAAMLLAGCSDSTVQEILRIISQLDNGSLGYRRVGLTLKRWKAIVTDILARKLPKDCDDTAISHSRMLCKSSHVLRSYGWSDADIKSAVEFHGRRRIPPFLLDPALVGALCPDPTFDQLKRLVPLANIGRTAPMGSESEIRSSLDGFVDNVTNFSWNGLSFQASVTKLLRMRRLRSRSISRWDVTVKASLESSRREGGKLSFFSDDFVDNFLFLPVRVFIPEKPVGDVYDITGTVVLHASEYDPDLRFASVAYSDVGDPDPEVICDARLGHLGLFWALWYLRNNSGLAFEAEEDGLNFGIGRLPKLRVTGGSLHARVAPVPEPGLKVRVITIVTFAASIVGTLARHMVDEPMYDMDPFIRIGLLSKVKLYDFMVKLNGGRHDGIADSSFNSLAFEIATSVDLTTATDTPPLHVVREVLESVHSAISGGPGSNLFRFAVDLACCRRVFQLPNDRTIDNHNCGIMMGEGLSGIFLNISSYFIRCAIHEFKYKLPDYNGKSVNDADQYIAENCARIQLVLEDLQFDNPLHSVQSGDDVSIFSFESISDHLILLYRCLGFKPSESSWYESNHFMTFTEEIALNTRDSKNWTFVDCVKPRLFRPLDAQGERAVASRVKQIGDSLRYIKDVEVRDRLIPLVDRMVRSCPSMSRVIEQYHIPVGLPTWLGGLGHPIGDELCYISTVPQLYRDTIRFLAEADVETLAQVLITSDHVGVQSEDVELLSKMVTAMLYGEQAASLEDVDELRWISLNDLALPRLPGEKYSVWQSRKRDYASSEGLCSLADFVSWYQSGVATRSALNGIESKDVPIAKTLRRKFEVFTSVLPDEYKNTGDPIDKDVFDTYRSIRHKMECQLWRRESVSATMAITNNPTFRIGFHHI